MYPITAAILQKTSPKGPATAYLGDHVQRRVPERKEGVCNRQVENEDVGAIQPDGMFPPVRYHDDSVTADDEECHETAEEKPEGETAVNFSSSSISVGWP